ncbi:MAG: hypothetical protein JST39_18365 [Bacteroidetes bacterium]|nr:hypothetical protein [Bacteroidota bacterium]
MPGTYVLGLASGEEAEELETLLPRYPELQEALAQTQHNLHEVMLTYRVPPPARVKSKLDDYLRAVPVVAPPPGREGRRQKAKPAEPDYIPLESFDTHIKVHKSWRWILLGIFILSKIFLALFLYYLIQSQSEQRQIKTLEKQLEQLQQKR